MHKARLIKKCFSQFNPVPKTCRKLSLDSGGCHSSILKLVVLKLDYQSNMRVMFKCPNTIGHIQYIVVYMLNMADLNE